MKFPAVLFDLDGTLLDTLADIAGAANSTLERCGFPTHSVDAYRYFIGDGVRVLFSRALPPESQSPETIVRCADHFRDAYLEHWNVHTRPYPGIGDLLEELARRSVRIAVLSNKPHEATVRCVEAMLSDYRFEVVLGQRDEVPHKPDPTAALEIASQMQLSPESFAFLGDTATDMQTAVRSQMFPVGVAWGFRPREELTEYGAEVIIERPGELLELLEGGC
ncbi:MAG: HAD family hydrolase [Pirellulaceae bacterium]